MKWIFAALFALIAAGLALGQTVYYANQATIQWDSVTTYQNGTPLPEGTVVTYEVYLKNGGQQVLGTTTATQYTVTFEDYKIYDVGVRAFIMINGTRYDSEIAWTSIDGVPSPFVLQRYPAPAKPNNIRLQ